MSKSKGQSKVFSVRFTHAQEAKIKSYMQEHQVTKVEAVRRMVTLKAYFLNRPTSNYVPGEDQKTPFDGNNPWHVFAKHVHDNNAKALAHLSPLTLIGAEAQAKCIQWNTKPK